MTQDAETVARLEALEEKATPGVWGVASDLPAYAIYAGKYRVVQTPNQNNYQTYGRSERWLGIEHKADADLIAALRNEALPLIRSLSTRLAAAEARIAELGVGTWYAGEDIDRLVRELDVALNGEDGAAKQAMLVDVVAQVKHERWQLVRRAALQPGAPDA